MKPAPAPKPIHRPRGSILAGLDVGSSKLCCLIARVVDGGALHVIGFAQQKARGIRAGAVTDLVAAAGAIGATVHAAEQMAGETLKEIVVGVAGPFLASRMVEVETQIAGERVAETDIAEAHGKSRLPHMMNGHAVDHRIIQTTPAGFRLDGRNGITSPVGLYGKTLGLSTHLLLAETTALRNLEACLEQNHLAIEGHCAAAMAAGLACLTDDERDLGALVIDLGGGTTDIAVFAEGAMLHVDTVPIGGRHVTADVARGLTTNLAHAERLKTLHGAAILGSIDDSETIEAPQIGEEPSHIIELPRSILVGIIQPRLEEIFEHVRAQLEDSGWAGAAGRRVVLTGGGAQLPGIRDLAQRVLDRQVRIGRPRRPSGLHELGAGPSFSVAVGLLIWAHKHMTQSAMTPTESGHGWFRQFGHWLKENF